MRIPAHHSSWIATTLAPWRVAIAMVICVCGCATSKQHQLESVARDWSRVIRASQIIPVYPLTEDLQPGDVFLVQLPIQRQQEIYSKRGYLPLDNHILRLNPDRFADFYSHSFLAGITNTLLPADWIRPRQTNAASWQPAPYAAFPTYSFTVKRGAGLNLAVPVQGVPVGMSLLGADTASGTIMIRKAATVGVDTVSLYRQVQAWASTNISFLAPFAPTPDGKKVNYLRIVSRVYVAGEMDVALADASSRAGGLDVGAPKPVDLLFADTPGAESNTGPATIANFSNNLGVLNELLKSGEAVAGQALPGGSLRVNAASSRFLSLSETFPYPLVIGYLGFDCAILPGGLLGSPIPTQSLLASQLEIKTVVTDFASDHASRNIGAWLESDPDQRAPREEKIREWLQTKGQATRLTSFIYDAQHAGLRNLFLQEKAAELNVPANP